MWIRDRLTLDNRTAKIFAHHTNIPIINVFVCTCVGLCVCVNSSQTRLDRLRRPVNRRSGIATKRSAALAAAAQKVCQNNTCVHFVGLGAGCCWLLGLSPSCAMQFFSTAHFRFKNCIDIIYSRTTFVCSSNLELG